MANTFGKIFRVTAFGESHGEALGCIIDGCPSGIPIEKDLIQDALNRRRPGYNHSNDKNVTGTTRQEADEVEILSGVFEGLSTGTPIALMIRNTSQKSKDYNNIKDVFRPGHADYGYFEKYGLRDYRGGGRSSARETAARVAAGAIAKKLLEKILPKSEIPFSLIAYTKEAAGIACHEIHLSQIEKNQMRAPDAWASEKMLEKIEELKRKGDSAGGIIECQITGLPPGLGEPVFDKLDAVLSHAMLSIGAVKGIEFGAGFESAKKTGSTWNDPMRSDGKRVEFLSNNAGGILGGLSNGNTIIFRLAVKPVPSIYQTQKTITKNKENIDILIEGRHDICVCPRIVPVVEAMAFMSVADLVLQNQTARY